MDLGVDDYAVVMFTQWYRGEWRIIGEYWNNGYALVHYLEYIKDAGYDIRAIRFPHDIKVREQGSHKQNGRAKSRLEIAKDYKRDEGLNWRLDVLPRQSIDHGIEATRRMIPNLVIDACCTYLIDCFMNYSKEWDERLQVWKSTPVHDEFSHGADTIRQFASSTIENNSQHESKLANYTRQRYSGVAI